MATITLNIATFRSLFSEFANVTTYPDVLVTMNWATATSYVDDEDYGWMQGLERERALYFMAGHITKIGAMIGAGVNPSLVNSTSVDNVSVSLTPPPIFSQFQWWLSTTPYGSQLLALLQMHSIGGFTVGGNPERSAFRKVGGVF
jgi:hypothetical protein